MSSPRKLSRHFAVLKPDLGIESIEVSATLYDELDARFDGFKGSTLISTYAFEEDWSSWEMHPAGDELVYLLSGDVEFAFRVSGGESRQRLRESGEYAVVPRGVWHTARVFAPTSMIFLTPGRGTEHRSEPPP